MYISGEELFKINKWLYENNQIIIAQVHSHPTHAFHSSTDDRFPMVTGVGQFSVVVPNFARGSLTDLTSTVLFRLNEQNRWVEVSRSDVLSIFRSL